MPNMRWREVMTMLLMIWRTPGTASGNGARSPAAAGHSRAGAGRNRKRGPTRIRVISRPPRVEGNRASQAMLGRTRPLEASHRGHDLPERHRRFILTGRGIEVGVQSTRPEPSHDPSTSLRPVGASAAEPRNGHHRRHALVAY